MPIVIVSVYKQVVCGQKQWQLADEMCWYTEAHLSAQLASSETHSKNKTYQDVNTSLDRLKRFSPLHLSSPSSHAV